MTDLRLSTPRLVLRPFADADLEPFLVMRADPRVARWQGWSDYTRADAEAFLARQAGARPDVPGTWFQLAITEDGAFVGDCALFSGPGPDEAEVGITLPRTSQGRGVAREALTALVRWLFEERGKRRVRAVVDTRNAPARALFEALGFREAERARTTFKGGPCEEITFVREG